MEERKECKCLCKCKKGFIYWFAVIVGVGFIVFASIGIGNKLAGDDCNCPKCASEEGIKTASKDKYEFNFYDGGIPGNKFTGFIDLKTGLVKVSIEQECSLTGTCTEKDTDIIEGKISNSTLNKVIEYLEKLNYPTIELNMSDKSNDKETRVNIANLINYVTLEVKGTKNISVANEGLDRLLK